MAVKWGVKKLHVITDSATVIGWMKSVLTSSHRVRSHGLAEMLIKRRLSIVAELVAAYSLSVSVELVASALNKADALTRVPQAWLRSLTSGEQSKGDCVALVSSLEHQHQQHHFGVERTLHLAPQVNPRTTRQEVEQVVRRCERCTSIDPAPVRWNTGELQTENCWSRLPVAES